MRIEIIDIGINNLVSVAKAFQNAEPNANISVRSEASNHDAKETPEIIVLPGVGNFGAAIEIIDQNGLRDYIHTKVNKGSKLIGICLGMQLLGNSSEEAIEKSGLSLISGQTVKLPTTKSERIPNVGWQNLIPAKDTNLKSMYENLDYYFTHSYHFVPSEDLDILSRSSYGSQQFVSAVSKENIIGLQFHPEKSGQIGARLINELVNGKS